MSAAHFSPITNGTWKDIMGKPFVTVSVNPTTSTGADFGPDSPQIYGTSGSVATGSPALSVTGGQSEADSFLSNQGGGVAVLINNQALVITPSNGNYFVTSQELALATGANLFTVTVGTKGSNANFTSNDQTGFNKAVLSLQNGGTIQVLSGTYHPTAEYIFTGNNITVYFSSGALIQIQAGVTFFSQITAGASKIWTNVFVCGNCTNCEIYNLNQDCQNTTNHSISALVIGGNVSNLCIYSPNATNYTRWARSFTGYIAASTGQVFDGNVSDISIYSATSSNCGSNATPDGGGTKLFQGASTGAITNVFEYGPVDLLCQFASLDMNPQNDLNGNWFNNINRFGGYATFQNPNGRSCRGIFIEGAYAAATNGIRIYGGKYDMLGSGYGNDNEGMIIGAQNRNVIVDGVEFWNADFGWSIIGTGGIPEQGGNFNLSNLRSIRCQTGAKITTAAAQGTILTDLYVSNCIADDQGAGVMATGLSLGLSATKFSRNLVFSDCDFSGIASGGTVLSVGGSAFAGNPGLLFRNCPGITDQGYVATPFSTTTTNELRPIGGTAAAPTANIAYRATYPGFVVTYTGGTSTITVTHADGTTLALSDSNGGATATPTDLTWYELINGSQTWSIQGNPTLTAYAIGPDYTVYMNGGNSYSNVTMPAGTLLRLSGFGGTNPTVTVAGVASPFTVLSAVSGFVGVTVPYGGTIDWNTLTAGTTTVKYNGSVVGSPFYRYREMSPLGNTAVPTNAIFYELFGGPMAVSAASAVGLELVDQSNTVVFSGATTLTGYRVEPGYRLQWVTTVGLQSGFRMN